MRSVHLGRLERFCGKERLESLVRDMSGWYGPPISVGGVPGDVYVTGSGEFVGDFRDGYFTSYWDRLYERMKRGVTLAMSLPDLSDFLGAGRQRGAVRFNSFFKVFSSGASQTAGDGWMVGVTPVAGSAGAAAPGGTVHGKDDTGAMRLNNGSFDMLSAGFTISNTSGSFRNYLLYDRLFSVSKTMSDNSAEAVTGVPTRYTGTNSIGNFVFPVVTSNLSATAHSWNTVNYENQDGTTHSFASAVGIASQTINNFDLPLSNWFMRPAQGDYGIRSLSQIQCSVNNLTGGVHFVIAHPIQWSVILAGGFGAWNVIDGVSSMFNLKRIHNNACLSILLAARTTTEGPNVRGYCTFILDD